MTANGLAALVDFLEPLHFTFCISKRHNDMQIFSNPFLIFDPDFLDDLSQRIKKLSLRSQRLNINRCRMKQQMGGYDSAFKKSRIYE